MTRGAALAAMFLSGAGALACETLWLRALSRAFGVSAYAVATTVSLYAAGLALGALAAARLRGKLPAYALLQAAAVAATGLGMLWLRRLPVIVASFSADRPLPVVWILLLSAPALLPATALLGASLPALTEICGSAAELYAANTVGAMAGAAAAAFATIGAWGESATLAWALAAGAAAAVLGRGPREPAPKRGRTAPASHRTALLLAVAGFCGLGYETLWSRRLVLLLGNSTYAFAALLVVYLGGLGLGAALSAVRARAGARPRLGALMVLAGAAAVSSAVVYKVVGLSLDQADLLYSPLRTFADFPALLFECALIVLPFAVAQGAVFAAALPPEGTRSEQAARVGELYAWSAAGGIAGALWAGFLGARWPGAHASLLALACAELGVGLAALAAEGTRRAQWENPAVAAGLALLGLLLAWRDPELEILCARLRQAGVARLDVLFHDESPAADVVGFSQEQGRSLYIDGIETSGNGWPGTWMGILPNILVENPRSTLVVCLGVGNTLRAAARFGAADGVELVGDVVKRMPLFDADPQNSRAPRDVFVEDGRSYLLRARRRYDVIIADASPPLYSAGAVNLYSREFLELARAHLEKDGIFALWLPTGAFESDYGQILRGAADVFAHIAVWRAPGMPGFLVLGSERAFAWPAGELERRLKTRLPSAPANVSEASIRAGLSPDEEALRAYARRFAPVTDDQPSVEFPLPRFWRGERLQEDASFLSRAPAP